MTHTEEQRLKTERLTEAPRSFGIPWSQKTCRKKRSLMRDGERIGSNSGLDRSGGELARESTWLNITGARAVREGKIKMTDEKCPQCWARSSVAFHFGDKQNTYDHSTPQTAGQMTPASVTTPAVPAPPPATYDSPCRSSPLRT